MKFKILALTIVMSILMAMPVFAQEVTDPNKVIKEETFNAEMEYLEKDFHNMEVYMADNYIKYLDGVIFNLNETVRIKKEIVDNYTNLAKVNTYFMTLLPNAIKDYEEAVAWVDYYKLYKKQVQADFATKYYK